MNVKCCDQRRVLGPVVLASLFIVFFVMASCKKPNLTEGDNLSDQGSEMQATVWPRYTRPFLDIPVCFVKTTPKNRELAVSWLKREFNSQKTVITLVDFSTCQAITKEHPYEVRNPYIRLQIVDKPTKAGSYTAGFACNGVGLCKNAWLKDPESTAWAVNDAPSVLHEVMHNLGFGHEHARTDRPRDICPEGVGEVAAESGGFVYEGSYDANSIMNYCLVTDHLSDGDIAAINQYYRMKPHSDQEPSVTHGSGGVSHQQGSAWSQIARRARHPSTQQLESDCDWMKRIILEFLGGRPHYLDYNMNYVCADRFLPTRLLSGLDVLDDATAKKLAEGACSAFSSQNLRKRLVATDLVDCHGSGSGSEPIPKHFKPFD